MKKTLPIVCLVVIANALTGCKPGPLTLGGDTTKTITSPSGQTVYVTYHASRKRIVSVPTGLTGDNLITSKLESAFEQDPILSPYRLSILTHRGVVTISGSVPDAATRNYAIKVARYTKGVLAVNAKNLTIRPTN